MKNIVEIENGSELVVGLEDIAKFSGYKIESVIQLIERNKKKFGIDTVSGSYKATVALKLTERQATHLIIYMNNTKEVMKFKDNLIEQFYTMKEKLAYTYQKQLQQKDIQLKIVRKNLSKAINARMKTYKDGFVSLRKYVKERDLILSEEEAWNVIEELGYIGIEEVQIERRMLVDENLGRQDGYSGIEFNTKALDLVFSEHIEKSISLFDFIEE